MKAAAASDAWELGEFDPTGQGLDRLMQEINILKLEGSVFCFDPKRSYTKADHLALTELGEHPITIEIHPEYGQPSVFAYKILQAIFQKITEEGYPYPETISFSQRELARLAGRTSWGSKTSRQLYHALMQLYRTDIRCHLLDNKTRNWEIAHFTILNNLYLSGKGKTITKGVVTIDRNISRSIGRRHVAFFNLQRLATLDVIGVVIYKRLFFHFSNIYRPGKTRRDGLTFCKDYETICREWLGGLKPERYKSKILSNQLGRHLEALKRTGIIRLCDIEKRVDGSGFKLTFQPGKGFFDDYEKYYLDQQQPQLRFKQTADLLDIQQPLEVVARFHELLGHDHTTFDEKETSYATHLLKEHNLAEVRDLIDYSVERARETNFRMRWLNAIKKFRDDWLADNNRQVAQRHRQQAVDACNHCDSKGMLMVKNRTGGFAARPCPHDIEAINSYEEENDLRRV